MNPLNLPSFRFLWASIALGLLAQLVFFFDEDRIGMLCSTVFLSHSCL